MSSASADAAPEAAQGCVPSRADLGSFVHTGSPQPQSIIIVVIQQPPTPALDGVIILSVCITILRVVLKSGIGASRRKLVESGLIFLFFFALENLLFSSL